MPKTLAVACAALSIAALSGGGSAAVHDGAPDVSAYASLGTWIDVYDRVAWDEPEAAVQAMGERGVRTLFLETSNYRLSADLKSPQGVARFVTAAHAAGLRIVAWYLPSFADLRRDLRRATAAIRFRTAGGERFDAFALDIESSVVKPASLRTSRALQLSARLRKAAGADYPLAAIVPAPRGVELAGAYWPAFPYRELARTFDVFVPMAYFTYRSGRSDGPRGYTLRNVAMLRERTGDPGLPIHVVGGLARDASARAASEFAQAAAEASVLGLSLYDFVDTRPQHWQAMAPEVARLGATQAPDPTSRSP